MANEWVKPATKDLWAAAQGTSAGVHSLKVSSFRYFRFFADGTVSYSLTHLPPARMARVLAQRPAAAAGRPAARRLDDKAAPDVWRGTFSLHRNRVYICVRSHYNLVNFTLELTHGQRGHFCRLEVANHFSRGLTPGATAAHHAESVGYAFWFFRAYPTLV